MSKIDFVVLWVDGDDELWKASMLKHKNIKDKYSTTAARFRDWKNLKYWFRAVETFAPWVNKIHFVTCGHYPKWLNAANTKLNLVKHSDFIEEQFLPTYNSHSIELNLHRIKDLSDKFVYFNDDMFLIKPIKESFFFKNDLPCDFFGFYAILASGINNFFPYFLVNNMAIINQYFSKKDFMKKHFFRVFNYKNGSRNNKKAAALSKGNAFCGFTNHHLPQPYLKDTFIEVWDKEFDYLTEVTSNKFRTKNDVNQYLMRYWQLVKAQYYPVKHQRGKSFNLTNEKSINRTIKAIEKQKYSMICINDSDGVEKFEETRDKINTSFEKILPHKSSFEI